LLAFCKDNIFCGALQSAAKNPIFSAALQNATKNPIFSGTSQSATKSPILSGALFFFLNGKVPLKIDSDIFQNATKNTYF
jgi:hypothetical protein